jgi:hypothetical protein
VPTIKLLIPAVLLSIEGLGSGVWVAGLLPSLPGRNAIAVVLVLARGLVGAMQFAGGWMLLTRRLPASSFAQAAFIASAVLATLESGFRLAPTNLEPTYRWIWVGVYCVYALGMAWYVRIAMRDAR